MRPRITPRITPALTLLVLAPFLGEVVSTSTTLPAFLSPQIGLFAIALYGGGALLIREVVHRRGLGLRGLLLLGAAYGVFEEALMVRSWFAPEFFDTPAAAAYSRVWGTNVIHSVHLTLFHVVVSIWCSITLVELAFPDRRTTPWVGPRGLRAAAAGPLVVFAISLVADDFFAIPVPQFLAAGVLTVVLVALGLRQRTRVVSPALPAPRGPRFAAPAIAAAVGAHFVLVWTLPNSPLPWPLGLLLDVLPLVWVVRYCRGLRSEPLERRAPTVIIGVLTPLLVVDVLVGLGGRIDLLVTAAITVSGLTWLRRRSRRVALPGAAESIERTEQPVQRRPTTLA